jgi:hypothetical protein
MIDNTGKILEQNFAKSQDKEKGIAIDKPIKQRHEQQISDQKPQRKLLKLLKNDGHSSQCAND